MLASIYIEPLLDIFFVQGIAIPSRGTEMSDDPSPTGTISRSSMLKQWCQHNVTDSGAGAEMCGDRKEEQWLQQ